MGAAIMREMSDAEVFGSPSPPRVGGGTRAAVSAAARRHGVPEHLALRVASQESAFRQSARSPKGAIGVMQLMPGTASDLGVDPYDEAQNIDGGVRYLGTQLKDFGDEKLAMAAYNAGPGAVRKYGGVPPYAETQKYVGMGSGAPRASGEMSDAEVFGGSPAASGGQSAPKPPPMLNTAPGAPQAAPQATMAGMQALAGPAPALDDTSLKAEGLGFAKGAVKAPSKLSTLTDGGLKALGYPADAINRTMTGWMKPGGFTTPEVVDGIKGVFDRQAENGVAPGKIGQFMGEVAGTAFIPGPPLVQGAISGGLLSDKEDVGGILKDAVVGGLAGRAGAFASDLATTGVGKLLSKAPKIMDLTALKPAVDAAYKAVDDSGFIIPKSSVAGMVDDFAKTVQSSALSKSAKDDAASIIQYARSLTKGDLTLSQLEKLRGDIYEAMVKKGGDTGRIGAQFRAQIDGVIDSVDNGLVRTARDLNARFKKADLVKRASQSADIRAEKDYGGDYGRKVKDRVFPLIDPANPNRNLRGATPDEIAALTKVTTGTKAQNLASTVGGMLDPRRLGGKMATSALGGLGTASGVATGGASIPVTLALLAAQMGTGFGLTGFASKTAKKNVDDLIRLMAAGGSKQALKKVPTKASLATQAAMERFARPAAVAVAAPAMAAARAKDRPKR